MRSDHIPRYFMDDFASMEKKAEMLEKSPVGRELEWRELHSLAGYFEAYRLDAGAVIFRQGDPGEFLCVISQGRADIIKKDTSHNEKIIASLGPGNTIGEMALIDGEPRSALVVAHTPVLMLVLTRLNFELLADQHPRLWGKLVIRIGRILSKRLRLTSGVLAEYLHD